MEKVVRDGKVAVLYSPGFGSGWYTWNPDYPELVFDPAIVALVENNKREDINKYIAEKYPDDDVYLGSNVGGLKIAWLPEGTQFEITEYDGSESIKTINSLDLTA